MSNGILISPVFVEFKQFLCNVNSSQPFVSAGDADFEINLVRVSEHHDENFHLIGSVDDLLVTVCISVMNV